MLCLGDAARRQPWSLHLVPVVFLACPTFHGWCPRHDACPVAGLLMLQGFLHSNQQAKSGTLQIPVSSAKVHNTVLLLVDTDLRTGAGEGGDWSGAEGLDDWDGQEWHPAGWWVTNACSQICCNPPRANRVDDGKLDRLGTRCQRCTSLHSCWLGRRGRAADGARNKVLSERRGCICEECEECEECGFCCGGLLTERSKVGWQIERLSCGLSVDVV